MADWLLLRLPRDPEALASWLVVDADGRPLGRVRSGSLAEAAADAAQRRVAALLGASDVLQLWLQLPQRAGRRAGALIAYAVEEHIAGDIEGEHCAAGARDAAGRTEVVVVARSLLESSLARLAGAGIAPALVCSEAALLPRLAGFRVALLDGESLATGDEAGSVRVLPAPPGAIADALELAGGETGLATPMLLYCAAAEWPKFAREVEACRARFASLKVQLLEDGPLALYAAQLSGALPVNLLQGAYAPRGSHAAQWQRWRMAAGLAALLVALHAGSQAWQLHQLRGRHAQLDQEIAGLAGPDLAAGAGEVRARAEALLRGGDAATGRGALLPALQALALAMHAAPDARLDALSFRDGALQLKLRAANAQSIDRINQALQSGGWHPELVSGQPDGDAFIGSVELRPGA
jgi:general secretion pathway protein L